MNVHSVMAIWIGMALIASFFSIKVGISVALVEILVGAIAGNIPGIREHVQQTGPARRRRVGRGPRRGGHRTTTSTHRESRR